MTLASPIGQRLFRRFALVAACVAALATTGCTDTTKVSSGPSKSDEPAPSTEVVSAPGPSIYPLHLALHDQNGDAIGLDVFHGHPTLVSMFYGSCPAACPLLVSHVKEVESHLTPSTRATTRVLMVSFDPERDTKEALTTLAQRHKVDTTRWRFASGPDEDVRQLAAAIGVTYRRLPDGAFAHDSVIVALDGEGRILARVEGTDPDLAPLEQALARAAR